MTTVVERPEVNDHEIAADAARVGRREAEGFLGHAPIVAPRAQAQAQAQHERHRKSIA